MNRKLAVTLLQSDSSTERQNDSECFSRGIFKSASKENETKAKRLVSNYLKIPLSIALPTPTAFPCKPFLEMFIKYNTTIPSSTTVERMFPLGNDVLKHKRSSLSDAHFEMFFLRKL